MTTGETIEYETQRLKLGEEKVDKNIKIISSGQFSPFLSYKLY